MTKRCHFQKVLPLKELQAKNIHNKPNSRFRLEQKIIKMKILKTLTIAVGAAASLAFCATSAKAISLVTTENSPVNISVVLTTNVVVATATGLKGVIASQKLVNKNLLTLLTNSDFAGVPFPTGSKLVIGWDWGGALLVVDKTGTNVLYDATIGTAGNSVTINFYNQEGAISFDSNATGTGSFTATWYNNASFALIDQTAGVNLAANGPCTEHITFKSIDSSNPTWTDSQSFKMYGANETNSSPFTGTLTGSITANGNGKGLDVYQFGRLEGSGKVP